MLLIPGHLEEKGNQLHIHDYSLSSIAHTYGTPTYVYNLERIRENYTRIRDNLIKYSDRKVSVFYALKANYNPEILRTLANEGAYADVLSIYESEFAIRCGFPSQKIMFTGTSVKNETMENMLDNGILINIDSFSMMRRLAKIAPEGLNVSIRWNPGKGAGFDPKVITAGSRSHGRPVKFGIEENKMIQLCQEALGLGFKPIGLHQHIGSGWTGEDVHNFLDTVSNTLNMAKTMTEFLGYELDHVDFGGGPGIPYKPDQKEFPIDVYARGICERVNKSGLDFENIFVEPGRYLTGDAGVLLTRVNTVEEKHGSTIVGVDAGFNTLLRPAFYGRYEDHRFKEAYHHILNVDRLEGPTKKCTIAGPLCETGDLLAIDREITIPKEGEVLAILGAGAYGYSMSNNYNLQPRPAEVVIPGPKLVTKRDSIMSLWTNYT
ncbi:diaminopimelate decarboxylase [Candidatus Bathyarchaeota archaeon]|nr:diaminopimelate decarboxylase [Candidatus Bathyarchaeota archaeon]